MQEIYVVLNFCFSPLNVFHYSGDSVKNLDRERENYFSTTTVWRPVMGLAEAPYLLWSLQMGFWKTGRSWLRVIILTKGRSPGSVSIVPGSERKVSIS